ncbi:hypothetical protein AUEXF2481DRAFT_696471 [Aureobasidium subglaciale EXF-2481]|uniref:C2H2-type domain-containing protein n=1 Tax=Aureobasidium subglaciale (strain EXF-2481) TaxID=1043005 RepID=A0A074YU63_AURSE|nr:uncharacterized protein AUEXF2481DRAFT_696471 [Aureobasidium subglaciale EXF-2481]KEQ99699.1 hypothetical protein AUEXF2481DRAFT_696471 [Aureobasidium subglaciale EXF-2481]
MPPIFKEPDLTAEDIARGDRHRTHGSPWVLFLRPRSDFDGSAWCTVHQNAWELVLKVLRFARTVDDAYYEAAMVAMRRWNADHAMSADPTHFLIYLEQQIQMEGGRLRENSYIWRAYSDCNGPQTLTFSRFEDSSPTEPNLAVDETSAEFFLAETMLNYRLRSLAYISNEECKVELRLDRRSLLGVPLTSPAMVMDATREAYTAVNKVIPNWLTLQLPAHLAPLSLSSPTPSHGRQTPSQGNPLGIIKRPHKCPFCRSCFSTEPRRDTHIQSVHGGQIALAAQQHATDQIPAAPTTSAPPGCAPASDTPLGYAPASAIPWEYAPTSAIPLGPQSSATAEPEIGDEEETGPVEIVPHGSPDSVQP